MIQAWNAFEDLVHVSAKSFYGKSSIYSRSLLIAVNCLFEEI